MQWIRMRLKSQIVNILPHLPMLNKSKLKRVWINWNFTGMIKITKVMSFSQKKIEINKYGIWDLSDPEVWLILGQYSPNFRYSTDVVLFHWYVLRKSETKKISGWKFLVTRLTWWHSCIFLSCRFAIALSIVLTLLIDSLWLWGEAMRWGVYWASRREGFRLLLSFLRPDQDCESTACG